MSNKPVPVAFRWTDVDVADRDGVVRTRLAMVPISRFEKVADRQFERESVYLLHVETRASDLSRRHYFACLRSAWKNLPEGIAHRYPSPEHLRKVALCKAGYRKEKHLPPFASQEEAIRVAATFKDVDEFCVTVVHPDNSLSIYQAQSQATYAMKDGEFQASKRAVLDLVAELIGVTAEQLTRHGRDRGHEDDGTRNPDEALGEAQGGARVEGPRAPARKGTRALASPLATTAPKNGEGP